MIDREAVSGGDEWRQGGVNAARAARAIRELVDEIVLLPREVLGDVVRAGIALQWESGWDSTLAVMWGLARQIAGVDWEGLLEGVGVQLAARLAARPDPVEWDPWGQEITAVWAVVSVEAAARAFRPLAAPYVVNLLHAPWQAAVSAGHRADDAPPPGAGIRGRPGPGGRPLRGPGQARPRRHW